MAPNAYILLTIQLAVLAILALPAMAHGEEVLPSLSDEKMGEYKNAFGKAISDSLSDTSKGGGGVKADGVGRPDSGLTTVTKRMRDDFDQKGPPPNQGQGQGQGPPHPPGGGFPPGPPGGIPGAPGGGPPLPGLGGPGQPGGPPPRPPIPGGGPGPGPVPGH